MSEKKTSTRKVAALVIMIVLLAGVFAGTAAALISAHASSYVTSFRLEGARTVRLEGLKIEMPAVNVAQNSHNSVTLTFPTGSHWMERWEFVRKNTGSRWEYETFVTEVDGENYGQNWLFGTFGTFTISDMREGGNAFFHFNVPGRTGPEWIGSQWINLLGSYSEMPTFVTISCSGFPSDVSQRPLITHIVFQHSVRFEYLNEIGTNWLSDTANVDEFTLATPPSIPSVNGQEFSHWTTTSGNQLNENITQSTVFRAVYTPTAGETLYQTRFMSFDDTVLGTATVSSQSPFLNQEQIPNFTGFVPPLYRFEGWRTKSGVWAHNVTITDHTDFYPVMEYDFALENILSVNQDRLVYSRGEYSRDDLARGFSNGIFVLPDDLSNQARGDAFLSTEFRIVNRIIPWSYRGNGETYFVMTLNTCESDFIPTSSQYNQSQNQLRLGVDRISGQSWVRLMYDSQELMRWAGSDFLRQPENNLEWEHNSIDFKLSLEGNRIRWELWYGAGRTIWETGLLPGVAYQYDGTTNFLGLSNMQFPDWSGPFTHSWQTYGWIDVFGWFPTTHSYTMPTDLPTIRVSGRHALGDSISARIFKVSFMDRAGNLIVEVDVQGNTALSANQIPTPPVASGWIFSHWFNLNNLTVTNTIRQNTVYWAAYRVDPDAPLEIKDPSDPPKPTPKPKPKSEIEIWQWVVAGIGILVIAYLAVRFFKTIFKEIFG